jgi:hypothetical protein
MVAKTSEAATVPVHSETFLPDPAYWLALGKFVEFFAHTEGVLFIYLSLCIKINVKEAKAVFSGLHVDQIIKHIRRLWQISKPDETVRAAVDVALTQLKLINGLRNSIVHHRSILNVKRERISTNFSRALTGDAPRE